MSTASWYGDVIGRYLSSSLDAEEFRRAFFHRFKREANLEDQVFEVLDELFADLDAYTQSVELLADNPAFYIDELALRDKARAAVDRLSFLRGAGLETPKA